MRAKVCFFDPKKTLLFLILRLVSCISQIGSCFDARLSRCFFLNYSDLDLIRFFGLCSLFSIYCLCCFFFSVRFPAIFYCFRVCILCSVELFFFLIIFIISLFCVKSHVMITSILVTGADVPSKTRALKNYSIISISLCKPIMME